MLTASQIDTCNEFHYGKCTRQIGPRGGVTTHSVVYRRNGQTKYWKTRPDDFRIPVKYGLRGYTVINQDEIELFHAAEDCPLRQTDGEVK